MSTHARCQHHPRREQLLKRDSATVGRRAATRQVKRPGASCFIQQRPAGADNFKLFVQEQGVSRVLIDHQLSAARTSHMSLDWWQPRPTLHVGTGFPRTAARTRSACSQRGRRARLPERIANTRPPIRSGSMTAQASSITS